ncbi:hypothetical protein RAMDARK_1014 [Rickettsia amblyommatis str. Darkwater]|nr:hypothetical protein RAMDARK_1014 [Rickettsia amblyommatis str. Darkwater]
MRKKVKILPNNYRFCHCEQALLRRSVKPTLCHPRLCGMT